MDGEVPRSGILLDLSTEGALEPGEPGVAGSFVVRVVRGRDASSPRRLGCVGDLGRRRDEPAWPQMLFRSLPAVLADDAAAGLDGLNGSMSSPSAVWMWVVATEVMLLAVSVLR